MLQRFISARSGATAIEYALIAMFVAVAIVGALRLSGNRLNTVFTSVSTAFR